MRATGDFWTLRNRQRLPFYKRILVTDADPARRVGKTIAWIVATGVVALSVYLLIRHMTVVVVVRD